MDKPFIPAAENNKHAILAAITPWLRAVEDVLEVGAGSGQHAVHFAARLPWLRWQASDLPARLPGIRAWVDEAALPNLPPPCALDVAVTPWPVGGCGALYAANLVHFMAWPDVAAFFAGAAAALRPGAPLLLYGPFNYGGRYVSEGNRRLDAWLAAHDPAFAIRDFEALAALAARCGFELCEDAALPANNRLLVWRRRHVDGGSCAAAQPQGGPGG
ncbi:MAG: DUF938 domain-containing protein [Gammaproteobacteria bacterium]